MATKIKLMRLGKMRSPHYRIVVADARTKRDGRAIETIGKYHPKEEPSFIQVDSDRAQYWLSVGAQPTEAVAAILRVTGDWQKFKGEPAPPPMRVAEPKADKKAVFEAAARENMEGSGGGAATTPKKKAAPAAKTEPVAPSTPDAGTGNEPPAAGEGDTPAQDAAAVSDATPSVPEPEAAQAGTGHPKGTDDAAAAEAADAALGSDGAGA